MSVRVGIDFGTSNSGVAVFDGQKVHLLPVEQHASTPGVIKTVLYITRDYRHYIGQEAVSLYYRQNVNRLRRYVKKWVGELEFRGGDMYYLRDVYTYVDELQPGRLLQLIKTALRKPEYEGTMVFERYYRLVDLISAYLSELKKRAEAILGEPIQAVTLGRPVHFSAIPEQDRRAEETLRQAAEEAGFRQVDFELEPVAAALDYERSLDKPQNALIFDFGGGTLDLTIMRLGSGEAEYRFAAGQTQRIYANGGIGVAGSDFDRAIIQKRLLPHFGRGALDHQGTPAAGQNITTPNSVKAIDPDLAALVEAVADWMALPDLSTPENRLKLERAVLEGIAPVRFKALQALIFNNLAFSFYDVVEQGKIALSGQGATTLCLKGKDIDLWELYTRSQFEHDILLEREQIEQVLLEAVVQSGLEPEQIDVVVKTGGSSRIPVFHEMLSRLFGPERIRDTDTFSSVTSGLAIRAYHGNIP